MIEEASPMRRSGKITAAAQGEKATLKGVWKTCLFGVSETL